MRHLSSAPLVAVALLVVGIGELSAQTAAVRGRMVEAGDSGVADVEITLSPPGRTTRSDEHGYFEFSGVEPGPAELSASRPGYFPSSVVIRVQAVPDLAVEIALAPVPRILDPLVTTVGRDARSLAGAAPTVSVTDSAALVRGRTVGLHEALRMMPGLQVASRYGTDDVNIGIRGSAARARQATRGVVVLLDGVPLTESDGAARVDLIELAAARQVQVVRGPASALHGGSSGGVVNVVSRTGRDSPGLAIRGQGGSFGFGKAAGRLGGLLAADRASGFAAASYTSSDGYRAHSRADILRAHASLDYRAGPATRFTLESNGSRLDSKLPGPLSQSEFDADPRAAAPSAEDFEFGRRDNRYRVGVRVESDIATSDASAYVFDGGRTLFFPIAGQIVDLVLDRLQAGGRLRAPRVAGLPIDLTIGTDYDRLYGIDLRWENVDGDRGALRDDGDFAVPGFAAYGQVDWRAGGSATVSAGLRYDRVAYEFESVTPGAIPRQDTAFRQVSPRLAFAWHTDDRTSLYASAGRAFEVPAIGELSPSPGAALHDVRPKTLWNFELGGRRLLADRLALEGALFLAAVRGEFVPVTVDGRSVPENAARSRNGGVEVGVTAVAAPWIDIGASYTFLNLRLLEYSTFVLDSTGTNVAMDYAGKRLPGAPRHRITAESVLRPRADLELGVQVEWQGVVYVETGNRKEGTWYRRPVSGPVQSIPFRAAPARALVHVNAALRAGPTTVFASVENLFGETHAGNVLANESLGRFYEPGTPAAVTIGFSWAGEEPDAHP